MIYMFLSNNPSSGDINLSNLSCYCSSIVIAEKDCVDYLSFLQNCLLCRLSCNKTVYCVDYLLTKLFTVKKDVYCLDY